MTRKKKETDLAQRRGRLARARWGLYPTKSAHMGALLEAILGAGSEADRTALMEECLTMLPPEDGKPVTKDLPVGQGIGDDRFNTAWAAVCERTVVFVESVKRINDLPRTLAKRVLGFLASLANRDEQIVAFAFILDLDQELVPYVVVEPALLQATPTQESLQQVARRSKVVRSARRLQRMLDLPNVPVGTLFAALCHVLSEHVGQIDETQVIVDDFFTRLTRKFGSMDTVPGVQVIGLPGGGGIEALLGGLGLPLEIAEMLRGRDGARQPDGTGTGNGSYPPEVTRLATSGGLPPQIIAAAVRRHNCGRSNCVMDRARLALERYEARHGGGTQPAA